MQQALNTRAFIVDGVIGGAGDYWYFYNAAKAINFAWFSSWKVVSASGKTLTIEILNPEDPDADARRILYSEWREPDPVVGMFWINGFQSYTSIQPLDIISFSWPSIASNKLLARVIKIISASRTQYVLELDKEVDCCTSYIPVPDGEGGFEEDPESTFVNIYHYGKESEQWRYVVDPFYFLGRRKQREIQLFEIPTDGVLVLEEATIHPPESYDPLVPNFVMEGWDGEAWVTISEHTRLHIKPGHSCYAFKTSLPTGSIRTAPSSSLTDTYSKFRVVYYVETTVDDPECTGIIGYDRCFHSRVDTGESIGNCGTTNGVGVTPEGLHVYCSERVYEEYEYLDEFNRYANPPAPGTDGIPDKVNVILHHPAGLADFPSSTGKCIQYGYCEMYVNSLTKMGDHEAPFNVDYTMAMLVDLWFKTDKQLRQRYVLATGSGGYVTERIGHPSILYLNGFYGSLTSPGGWHPWHYFRGDGTWFTKAPINIVDSETGSQTLVSPGGLEKAYLLEYDEATETYSADPDRKGNIPDTNSGNFRTKCDPFNPGATVTDDLLEYIGAQIERDSGQITQSRGLSGISVALGAEDILAPNFDLSSYDLQISSRATYQREEATGDGILKVLPYRQENKPERNIGSRVISSVTSLGDRRYKVVFENETKTFSRFNIGSSEIGDSYDEIFAVQAGGGPCVLAYEHQGLYSFEGDKQTGSRNAGAAPLDCIELPDGMRFVIESVHPHGDAEAPTWGSRQITNKGSIGGFFKATVNNDINNEPLLPIEVIGVKRTSDNTDFAVVNEEERPELLVNQCWYDGDIRFYFTSLNGNEWVEVTYKDSANTTYVQGFWIQPYFTVHTDTDYGEWTSASTKTISIGATSATVVVGGWDDPAPGSVRINDNGGKIQLTFNITDAPHSWRIHMTYAVNAAAPTDDWSIGGNYLSFGKKRDYAIVIADGYNGTDYFQANSVVGESAAFLQLGTVFLPQQDLPVLHTGYQTDSFTAITPGNITPNAASGTIRIASSYVSTKGQGCLKLPGIQMVDNRGKVPASIVNKTQAVIDATTWVMSPIHGIEGASWGFAAGAGKTQGYCYPEIQENYAEGNPNGNYISAVSGGGDFHSVAQAGASISISSSGISYAAVLKTVPEGTIFHEAIAVLSNANLTRTYDWFDIVGNVGGTETTIEDIGYTLVAVTGPKGGNVIATIPSTNTTSGTTVVDFTDALNAMYALRNDDSVYGYAIFPSVGGVSGDLEGYVKSLVELPPMGPHDYTGDGEITPPEWPCNPGDGEVGSWEGHTTLFFKSLVITWTSVSIQAIYCNVELPQDEKNRDLIQPRYPALIDLAS